MSFRTSVHPLSDIHEIIYKQHLHFDYWHTQKTPITWTKEQCEAASYLHDWLDFRINMLLKKLLKPSWSKRKQPFHNIRAIERAIINFGKYPYLRDNCRLNYNNYDEYRYQHNKTYRNIYTNIYNIEEMCKAAGLKINRFLARRYKKRGWDLEDDGRIVKRNIELILTEKCGSHGPHGDLNNDYNGDYFMNPIEPFTYDIEKDIVYMTHNNETYGISERIIPRLAGITLWETKIYTINDYSYKIPVKSEDIRPCGYRGRDDVIVYESVSRVRKLLKWRIEAFLRLSIHRYKTRNILADKVGDDVAKYVIMPFVK